MFFFCSALPKTVQHHCAKILWQYVSKITTDRLMVYFIVWVLKVLVGMKNKHFNLIVIVIS